MLFCGGCPPTSMLPSSERNLVAAFHQNAWHPSKLSWAEQNLFLEVCANIVLAPLDSERFDLAAVCTWPRNGEWYVNVVAV